MTEHTPDTAAITLNHCFLRVEDIDSALAFYRDLVGLPVDTDVAGEDGYRWVTLRVPSQPGLEIGLEEERYLQGDEADRRAAADLRRKGMMPAMIFSVPDVDATFARLKAGGAEVLSEPVDQFYGVRDCAFRDPGGNMVRFTAPLPQA